MGGCLGRRTHQRMNDVDSSYDATSLAEPRGSRFIPKWLKRRPKFSLRSANPYSNLGQDDLIERELYNPVVQGRELWPHETPDVWAVPADSGITVPGVSLVLDAAGCAVERDSVNNNLCALTPKSRVHTDSHSSIELEWENEEGMPSTKPVEVSTGSSVQRQISAVAERHERMSLSSMASHRSRRSSLSNNDNELEWDEDFASPNAFQGLRTLDFDTEQLIAEIDKMTEKALRETERDDTSLPPFDSMESMPSL
ncbi:uncharacterized protein LOC111261670 [Varroa jacobsoni]|uniref:Uncharacterized protein n=1 Tax=Varroa destructor TaxID=109461 RepID=A0A7M7IVV4_VARDE|nr:uncharacterized protein LOC111242843 isoform X2 [Varroa destructor]XP_022691030.1 uncharacterized protein LOC111261670 [Varroa jacobsoni]